MMDEFADKVKGENNGRHASLFADDVSILGER
jgi:hypothetical protein